MADPTPHNAALMINDLDFEGGDELRAPAEAAADRIAGLRDAADAAGVPVIYVNDNFGQWQAERSAIVAHGGRKGSPGRAPRWLRATATISS